MVKIQLEKDKSPNSFFPPSEKPDLIEHPRITEPLDLIELPDLFNHTIQPKMPSTRNSTKNKRPAPVQTPGSQDGTQQPAKRRVRPPQPSNSHSRPEDPLTASNVRPTNPGDSTPESDHHTPDDHLDIPLDEINLQNYLQAKNSWPLERVRDQLAKQGVDNSKFSPLILAEAQNLLESFEHSLHMLAMISSSNVDSLKQRM